MEGYVETAMCMDDIVYGYKYFVQICDVGIVAEVGSYKKLVQTRKTRVNTLSPVLPFRSESPNKFFRYFEALSAYLNNDINTMIPLTFMLGFFVASVVKRWSLMLNSFGWIDE